MNNREHTKHLWSSETLSAAGDPWLRRPGRGRGQASGSLSLGRRSLLPVARKKVFRFYSFTAAQPLRWRCSIA